MKIFSKEGKELIQLTKLDIIQKTGFPYFKQIKDFIHMVNTNKEKFIKMKEFKTLKIPENLKYEFGNQEIKETFKEELEKILKFSQNNNKILIFLSGSFWKKMINVFENPDANNIYYLYYLRGNFKNYFNIVEEKFKENNKLKPLYKNAEETD